MMRQMSTRRFARAQPHSRVGAVRCFAAEGATKVVFKLARRVEFGQVGRQNGSSETRFGRLKKLALGSTTFTRRSVRPVIAHCNLQSLAVIGTQPELGAWNAGNATPMTWTDGDVWKAEVEFPAG